MEQKGTRNKEILPVNMAAMNDNKTAAHQDRQKSQLNIFEKKSFPLICTHSITPHLRSNIMINAASKAITIT